MRIDRASRRITATAERIYRALTHREAVQSWLPPAGAHGVIEAFDPRPGGAFRMTLVFETPGDTGRRKSSANTDVVDGEFLRLIPDALVEQRFTFQSDDPAFAGAMVMTWTLTSLDGATQVDVTAEGVPSGIRPEDHQQGMASSLVHLAQHVGG